MTQKKRILVIDDEEDLVNLLTVRLEADGYEVLIALDGQAGLDKAHEERPDLILLDVMMPIMDGYQVCRFLKFDDELKNIPVIMLTARIQEKDKKIGQNVGADAYLTKPFDLNELSRKIRAYLK